MLFCSRNGCRAFGPRPFSWCKPPLLSGAHLPALLPHLPQAAHDAARLRLQLADASSRLGVEARAHEAAAQRAQRAERRVQELQGLEGREAALREAEEALDQASLSSALRTLHGRAGCTPAPDPKSAHAGL